MPSDVPQADCMYAAKFCRMVDTELVESPMFSRGKMPFWVLALDVAMASAVVSATWSRLHMLVWLELFWHSI